MTPRLSLEVAGRQADVRYEAGTEFDGTRLAQTLNREARGVEFTLRHRVTPLTTLALRSEVLEERFELSPARNSDSRRVMPGVEFAPQALIKGSAYVGYRKFTPLSPDALPEFGGVVADLGLSYALLGSTVFGATYRRDLTYSYSELQPFFIDNAFGVSIRRALGGRFDLLLSGDRHKYDYENLVTAGPDLAPRVDTTWAYGASLGYRLGRDSRIGFGVSHLQRESTIESRSYKNLRFGTTFGHGF
ncbi:MAG: outer membrane beta-barrel protein [Candidatus Limnocylindrales bacterium]